MHLALQNAETINRLVDQGEFLLKSFHDEHRNAHALTQMRLALRSFAPGQPRAAVPTRANQIYLNSYRGSGSFILVSA